RRDGVEHERRHRGVLKVCGLTDERILLRGNANLQPMTSGCDCTIAHKPSIPAVRTLSGQHFLRYPPPRWPAVRRVAPQSIAPVTRRRYRRRAAVNPVVAQPKSN